MQNLLADGKCPDQTVQAQSWFGPSLFMSASWQITWNVKLYFLCKIVIKTNEIVIC